MAAKQLGRMPYAWQLINFLKENDIKLQEAPFSVVAHKVLHCFPTMDELRQSGAEHVSLCSVPYYVVGADTTRPLDEQPLDDEDMEDAPPPEGTAEGDGNGDEEAAVAPALAQAQATPTRRQRGIYRQKPTCKRSFSCCQKNGDTPNQRRCTIIVPLANIILKKHEDLIIPIKEASMLYGTTRFIVAGQWQQYEIESRRKKKLPLNSGTEHTYKLDLVNGELKAKFNLIDEWRNLFRRIWTQTISYNKVASRVWSSVPILAQITTNLTRSQQADLDKIRPP